MPGKKEERERHSLEAQAFPHAACVGQWRTRSRAKAGRSPADVDATAPGGAECGSRGGSGIARPGSGVGTEVARALPGTWAEGGARGPDWRALARPVPPRGLVCRHGVQAASGLVGWALACAPFGAIVIAYIAVGARLRRAPAALRTAAVMRALTTSGPTR